MNMVLESDLATLKQQVFCMQLDWKKEQDVTLQLENDLTFKEDQLQLAHEANQRLQGTIDTLNAEAALLKDKMKGMAPKEQKLRKEVEVAEVQFEETDRVQEEIAELE